MLCNYDAISQFLFISQKKSFSEIKPSSYFVKKKVIIINFLIKQV